LTVRLSEAEYSEITDASQRGAVSAAGLLAAAGLAVARGQVRVSVDQELAATVDELAALRLAVSRAGHGINRLACSFTVVGRSVPGDIEHALRVLLAALDRIDMAADALVRRRS